MSKRSLSCIFRFFFVFLLLAALAGNGFSQNYTYSPYSAFALGLMENNGVSENYAMGSAGIAAPSENYLNTTNPASFTSLDSTSVIFHIGVFGKFSRFNSGTDNYRALGASVRYLSLGFKVKSWWGVAVGLAPFSTRGYTFTSVDATDGYNNAYNSTITGSGSLNRFYWANSFRVAKNLYLGLDLSYLFGLLSQQEQIQYNAISTTLSNTLTNQFHNVYADFGMQYRIHLGNNTLLSGLTFTPGQSLNTLSNRLLTNGTDTVQNDPTTGAVFKLPMMYGIGLGYQWKNQLRVMADYRFEQWSKTNYHYESTQLTNCNQLFTGVEYTPEKRVDGGYFNLVTYRAGFRYERSYLVVLNNQLYESAITFGLSFPLKNQLSKISVAVELGRQGTLANKIITENYGRITIGLALHDQWFLRRQFE